MNAVTSRLLALLFALFGANVVSGAAPEAVTFASADGKTRLTGYLFTPAAHGPHPAIVLLHGRGGLYSSLKPGVHTADALTMRHRMWAEFWASRGYVALLVDSFGPRGYPEGFPKHSYDERPPEVSEQLVRPLDAHGALRFLRARSDVVPGLVAVQGWSNGGMAVLAALAADGAAVKGLESSGFRAAIALYPSCRHALREPGYRPYAPLLILAAGDDDEVSPEVCRRFSEALLMRGQPVEFVLYPGAHHSFDDPGRRKQSHPPNRVAIADSLKRAEAFFAVHLRERMATRQGERQ